jgi:phage-related minor tail protein
MARETLPDVDVRINADTRPFAEAIESLGKLSGTFGNQLTGALRSAVVSGKSLEDVLRRIGLNMAGMALSQGLKPLSELTSGLFANFTAGLARAMPFAKGGVTPFASGDVVSAPTYFPTGGGLGLMGEAGAEAILPLRRSADGRLGVAAAGGGAQVSIVFNVTTPDAGSFRKSEAQITGMLARAVSRGARTM